LPIFAFWKKPDWSTSGSCAMRSDCYRYVEWRHRLDNHFLTSEQYDHETDPLENENRMRIPLGQLLPSILILSIFLFSSLVFS
jgi:hypothetical protein